MPHIKFEFRRASEQTADEPWSPFEELMAELLHAQEDDGRSRQERRPPYIFLN